MDEVWHRFENWLSAAPVDEGDNICGESRMNVRHVTLKVIKNTPKGIWLTKGFGDKHFVLLNSRKKYASPTIKEAMESFRARKLKEAAIHRKRAQQAIEALYLAEGLFLREVAA